MTGFASQLVHTSGVRAACLVSPCPDWEQLAAQLASGPLVVHDTW
jgi:hypothetical protein